MSDVNFDKYPCSLSFLDKYYLFSLENGPTSESVVFFHEHATLNVLAFYLCISHLKCVTSR